MNRRTLLLSTAAALILPGTIPGAARATAPVDPTVPLPIDPATVVLRLSSSGGFVPRNTDISSPPQLVITAAGEVYTPVLTDAFPGPLVTPIDHRTLTPAGVQRVLLAAQRAGLLADPPPSYDAETTVADAPTSVLTLTTAAGTVTHQAYALGMSADGADHEPTAARRALADFVRAVTDLATLAGDELSGPTGFAATEYRLAAETVNIADYAGNDPAPTVVPWPASAGIDLATASTCVRLAAERVGDVLAGATQMTFFADHGSVYRLAVRGVLPGDPSC